MIMLCILCVLILEAVILATVIVHVVVLCIAMPRQKLPQCLPTATCACTRAAQWDPIVVNSKRTVGVLCSCALDMQFAWQASGMSGHIALSLCCYPVKLVLHR